MNWHSQGSIYGAVAMIHFLKNNEKWKRRKDSSTKL